MMVMAAPLLGALYCYGSQFARLVQTLSAQSVSDSDIPRAKNAKVAKLEIIFSILLRPLRALREIFRSSVAAPPRWPIVPMPIDRQ
jgi:hypothetical protein